MSDKMIVDNGYFFVYFNFILINLKWNNVNKINIDNF